MFLLLLLLLMLFGFFSITKNLQLFGFFGILFVGFILSLLLLS